jgi:glutaredoxin
MNKLVQIDIYSRPGCHLCDDAKIIVDRVRSRLPFDVRVINVETEPELEKTYGDKVPAVCINGNLAFKYRVDEAKLERMVKKLCKT